MKLLTEDGVVTDDEYDQLCRAATLLQVDTESAMSRVDPFRAVVDHLELTPGMTVCFTGQGRLDGECVSRATQEKMAQSHGLIVAKSVTKKGPDVVVAADGESRSTKARKARQIGIPICSFSELVAALTNGTAVPSARAASSGVAMVCIKCGGSWMAPRQSIGSTCVDCTRDGLLQRTTEAAQRVPTIAAVAVAAAMVVLVCGDCGSEWERPTIASWCGRSTSARTPG